MVDVFISYKNSERARVSNIARALEAEGYSVWWDNALRGGEDYSEVIDQQISSAKVIMPIWSRESVKSQWVRAEAERGRDKLLPVRIEDVQPPLPYNKLHTLDLIGWSGDRSSPAWQRVRDDLRSVISGGPRRTVDDSSGQKRSISVRTIVAWIALPTALISLATISLQLWRESRLANAATTEQVSPAIQQTQPTEDDGTTAQTGAPSRDIIPRPAGAPQIANYSDAMSALASNGSPLRVEICRADRTCGVRTLHVGEVITVRITSPVSGRLILIDQNAIGRQMQIVPNGLSPAGASFTVRSGETIEVPSQSFGFEFAIGEPLGQSRLIAVVLPEQSALPAVVAENRASRDIRIIPTARRDDWAESVSDAFEDGGVAFGHVDYEIAR